MIIQAHKVNRTKTKTKVFGFKIWKEVLKATTLKNAHCNKDINTD